MFEAIGKPSLTRRPFSVVAIGANDAGPFVTFEVDTWEGGSTPDDVGMWHRSRLTVTPANVRIFVSPSVSYWHELSAVLEKAKAKAKKVAHV